MIHSGLITDIALTLLLAAILFQLGWLADKLFLRGAPTSTLRMSQPPLLAIWVLLWPVYTGPDWIMAGILLIVLPLLLTKVLKGEFWKRLSDIWSEQPFGLWPAILFIIAIGLCSFIFVTTPEYGLGIALSLILGNSIAGLADRIFRYRLQFRLNPEQTLAGHLLLIAATALACGWSIRFHHHIAWEQVLIATTLVGIIASITRAITPKLFTAPAMVSTMYATLYFL